jgi:hypothetical protein
MGLSLLVCFEFRLCFVGRVFGFYERGHLWAGWYEGIGLCGRKSLSVGVGRNLEFVTDMLGSV